MAALLGLLNRLDLRVELLPGSLPALRVDLLDVLTVVVLPLEVLSVRLGKPGFKSFFWRLWPLYLRRSGAFVCACRLGGWLLGGGSVSSRSGSGRLRCSDRGRLIYHSSSPPRQRIPAGPESAWRSGHQC